MATGSGSGGVARLTRGRERRQAALELGSLVASCGVSPQRTADPAQACELLLGDGAAVLVDLDGSFASARALARSVLGDRLLASGHPVALPGDAAGSSVAVTATGPAERRATAPHTDGAEYGPLAPDVVFLLCQTPSPGDGDLVVVDERALLRELAASAAGEELASFVGRRAIEHASDGRGPSLGPIALHLDSGTVALRRSLAARPAEDDPDPATASRLAGLWGALIDAVGALAPRCALDAGEALIVDNTRVAHGHDAYASPQRVFWRSWGWTERAGGVPRGELWSDGRMSAASAPLRR